MFYGIKTDGVVQKGQEGPGFSSTSKKTEGSLKYCDLDGDGYITDEERKMILYENAARLLNID